MGVSGRLLIFPCVLFPEWNHTICVMGRQLSFLASGSPAQTPFQDGASIFQLLPGVLCRV